MRPRLLLLVVPILLLAGFVALNWTEFARPVPLTFGLGLVDAPLGLVMLGLLGLAFLCFLGVAAMQEGENLREMRRHTREMQAQRELADRAEASRFTELRTFLEHQSRDALQREEALVRVFSTRVRESQQQLFERMEQNTNSLAASIGELEDRVERMDRLAPGAVV